MGVERVLQAARRLIAIAVVVATATSVAYAAPKRKEKVAIIDLGPSDPAVRQKLAAAAVAGGLEPFLGDGIDAALAGESTEPDAVQLAAAMAEAQRAFGSLDCVAAIAASKTAIGIAAARQAAGFDTPELPRAWTYVLLCADRTNDADTAVLAARRLRVLGGSPDVPADLWSKYPEVDTMLDHELLPVEIRADADGAEIWIDFQRAGASPLKTTLPLGEHVIAAAFGTRRGWAAGTVVRSQPVVAVPLSEQRAPYAELSARIASWKGAVPSAAELAAVLDPLGVRVALVRRGIKVEAWGHIGRSEPPRILGNEDGVGTVADADRLVALIADRVQTWNDRAPDPDVPLLVEDPKSRRGSKQVDEPTRWWVYATILGALAVGGGLVYLNDTSTSTQRVELHYP